MDLDHDGKFYVKINKSAYLWQVKGQRLTFYYVSEKFCGYFLIDKGSGILVLFRRSLCSYLRRIRIQILIGFEFALRCKPVSESLSIGTAGTYLAIFNRVNHV
jgi:hypothetical protein